MAEMGLFILFQNNAYKCFSWKKWLAYFKSMYSRQCLLLRVKGEYDLKEPKPKMEGNIDCDWSSKRTEQYNSEVVNNG